MNATKGLAAMNTDTPVRRVIGSPWLAAILAVLELMLGFAMLSFPYLLGASAVWVCGFVLDTRQFYLLSDLPLSKSL